MTEARLHSRTALITGSSRGIGRAIAVEFARNGADVAVNYYSNKKAAAETVRRAEAVAPDETRILFVQADVADEDNVERMFETVEAELGPVCSLVNNAGVISQTPLVDLEPAEWHRVISTNLTGTYLCSRRALPNLQATDNGAIVNITSDLGRIGASELVHYSASKGGVISLTRALAREVAPDVRVNAVAPGPVATDMLEADLSKERQEEETDIPMGRVGRPEEIAPAAVYLMSDEASFVTGQVLDPNGGSAMY